MEQEMSGQSNTNKREEVFSLSSGMSQITRDLIYSNSFILRKIKNGKANCDKCSSQFPSIHPAFVVVDEVNEEILCYPCNYKRLGIDVAEFYKNKRSSGELEALKLQNQQAQQLKESRKKGKVEKAGRVKKEPENKKPESPDLFSGL